MNELITIKGVRGRVDTNGNPEINLEDVARGLGFTQTKNGTEYVRWETIFGYLSELKFSQQVGKDDFIPENIFYKLCFKASNETARKFQDTVTDEVLPSIRKHGAYMTPDTIEKVLLNPDTIIDLATRLKSEQQARQQLEQTIETQKPQVLFAEQVSNTEGLVDMGTMAKLLYQKGIPLGRNKLFDWLRDHGFLMSNNKPYQQYVDAGYFATRESTYEKPKGGIGIRTTTFVTGKGQIFIFKKLHVT